MGGKALLPLSRISVLIVRRLTKFSASSDLFCPQEKDKWEELPAILCSVDPRGLPPFPSMKHAAGSGIRVMRTQGWLSAANRTTYICIQWGPAQTKSEGRSSAVHGEGELS